MDKKSRGCQFFYVQMWEFSPWLSGQSVFSGHLAFVVSWEKTGFTFSLLVCESIMACHNEWLFQEILTHSLLKYGHYIWHCYQITVIDFSYYIIPKHKPWIICGYNKLLASCCLNLVSHLWLFCMLFLGKPHPLITSCLAW